MKQINMFLEQNKKNDMTPLRMHPERAHAHTHTDMF